MALRALFFPALCASLVAAPSFANPTIIIQTPGTYLEPIKTKPTPEQRYREAEIELLAPYEKAIEDEKRRAEMKVMMGEIFDEKMEKKEKKPASPIVAEPESPFGKIGGIGAVGGLGKVGAEPAAK